MTESELLSLWQRIPEGAAKRYAAAVLHAFAETHSDLSDEERKLVSLWRSTPNLEARRLAVHLLRYGDTPTSNGTATAFRSLTVPALRADEVGT